MAHNDGLAQRKLVTPGLLPLAGYLGSDIGALLELLKQVTPARLVGAHVAVHLPLCTRVLRIEGGCQSATSLHNWS